MPTEPRRSAPSAFWLAFWLFVPLVAAKAVHWGWPEGDFGDRQVWVRDVIVSSAADVGFVLGFGAMAFVLLAALSRWPRLARVAGVGLVSLGAVCALYAAASVQIFDFLRSPLTYPLLYLAGDMRSMRSSIGNFVTAPVVAALVLVTMGYVVAVRLTAWRFRLSGWRTRLAVGTALAVAGTWVYEGRVVADGRWSDRPDLLIACSPHWELLASVAEEIRGGNAMPHTDQDFPREYLSDFSPAIDGKAIASTLAPASLRARGGKPWNVIQVVLESTGARYMSLYGSRYPTTPNLEAAARHALVYDNFYSHAGFTANSLFALTLSRHPYMTWREYTQEYPEFPGDSMPEQLKSRGYRSAFLTSGYLDYVCMGCFLQNRGFDAIEDWKTIGGGEELTSWGGDERRLVDRTLQWVDGDRTRPFYLELWTQQSHHPYELTPGSEATDFFAGGPLPPDDYDLGRYLNTLSQVDRQLGRLFAALTERGLDRNTIVIVTGDHGEAFGDPHRTWGHGFRIYQEGVRIPFMIWSPTLFPQGRHVGTIGGHVDVNPTVADLLGVPPAASWEGRSLFARDRVPRTYFYAANDDYLLGAREGRYKYIYNVTRGRDELYDLESDPDELANVADQHRDLCHVLRQRLAAWKAHAAGTLEEARRQMARSADKQQASLQ